MVPGAGWVKAKFSDSNGTGAKPKSVGTGTNVVVAPVTTVLAVGVFPRQLHSVGSAVSVNGVPETHRKRPSICHGPRIFPSIPSFRKWVSAPIGSCHTWLNVN